MLLQPLVENALMHGIGGRPGPGTRSSMFARSTDHGNTFAEPLRIAQGAGRTVEPQLAVAVVTSCLWKRLVFTGLARPAPAVARGEHHHGYTR